MNPMIEYMAKELASLLWDLPGKPSGPEEDLNFWEDETKSLFPEWEPWFRQLPAGRDESLFQLGFFLRAEPLGDDLLLCVLVDEELTYSRDGMLRGLGDRPFPFEELTPLTFLPIQAIRWMRFSLSIFDLDMNQQFWRTKPGEYFGVNLPVENNLVFNGTSGLLCRIYEPAGQRGLDPADAVPATVQAVYQIYKRWVEVGCPSAWLPETFQN
jgi:hypothetical protein